MAVDRSTHGPARPNVAIADSDFGWRDRARIAVQARAPTVLIGLALASLAWPIGGLQPTGGIDGSWQTGIAMAADEGLRWGVDVVFTYGPLGFLSWPRLVDPRMGAVAWAFVVLTRLAMCIALVWLSTRRETWRWALPLAALAAVLSIGMQPTASLLFLSVAACFGLIARAASPPGLDRRAGVAMVAGLAAVGSFVLLIKLNDGLGILGAVAVTSLGIGLGGLAPVAAAAGGGVALIALWTVIGQRPGDLAAYLSTGLEISSGYSEAMGLGDRIGDWQYVAVAIAMVLAGVTLWRRTSAWDTRHRLALAGAVSLFLFLAWKNAFVRHGGGGFFEAAALITVWVIPWNRRERERRLLVLAILGMAILGTARSIPMFPLAPLGPQVALEQAWTLATTQTRIEVIEAARSALRAEYAIPQSILTAAAGQPVHVEPYETSVAWAYPELRWRPLPVLQPYAAYTQRLDEINARSLASPSGPGYLLRNPPASIDGRNPFHEAPRSSIAAICRFREVMATERWQLLARGPNRCGPVDPLGTAVVRPGDLIPVPLDPRPGRLVVVHIEGIEVGPLATLRAFVDKSPTWWMSIADQGAYRLVPGTVGGPLLLASPAALGWSSPFSPPGSTTAFRVVTGPSVGVADPEQPDVTLTVTFESIPLQPG